MKTQEKILEENKDLIIAFKLGRGGHYHNSGFLSYIGEKNINDFTDDLFLNEEETFWTDGNGNELLEVDNDGTGKINIDNGYDTTYACKVSELDENEISAILNRGRGYYGSFAKALTEVSDGNYKKGGHPNLHIDKGYKMPHGYGTVKGAKPKKHYDKGASKHINVKVGEYAHGGNEVVKGIKDKQYEKGGRVKGEKARRTKSGRLKRTTPNKKSTSAGAIANKERMKKQMSLAKEIKAKHPEKKWTSCVSEASKQIKK